MKINDIRKAYLDFFESKKHKIVPSAPMVVKNDPTLMFTNAGMNQFKDFFLGYSEAKDKRIANTQKCLRVSGKHNDLEEVGVDTYHHTMFEMLGNWSFGDYFKKESIDWAWELLTKIYKIDTDRIYVTVFRGDEQDGVPADTESEEYWRQYMPADRILKASKKDNFWEMGDTGPCGPCSEIHVDMRDEADRKKVDGKTLVNNDHPQVIEIWNLVFMQFNRKANGELEKLPATHVDTGMGLERLAMVLQGKKSNYDTDMFQFLIQHLVELTGKKYGQNESTDIAMRVIVDHIRAISFSIADGQMPSNSGAGYVIRRILRRAVRYGYQALDLKEPFLCNLSVKLGQAMGDAFPELKSQGELIQKVIFEEEASFFRTLETGIKRINDLITKAKTEGKNELAGAAVFELYDTFGFPFDLTSLIARENNILVDERGFELELAKQKDRSRAATQVESDDWVILMNDDQQEFIGYDFLKTELYLVKYRKVKQKNREFYQLVFNVTPFYAEGGGQVGDQGTLTNAAETIEIFDTKKENNLIIHLAEKLPKDLTSLFKAEVKSHKRKLTQANHSATHLLHHALREVLGKHVEQKGSLVNDEYLRFDFSHFAKVTDEELAVIEQKVNEKIKAGIHLDEKRTVPITVAQGMGAMALFGEKYGDFVRVIKFGDSVELCGGCHVKSTSEIGLFKLVSEGSVAAGIRRIEAITSEKAELYYKERAEQFEKVSALLNKPADLAAAVEDLLNKKNALTKEIEKLQRGQLVGIKEELKKKIQDLGGVNYASAILELDGGLIKDLCFQLKGEVENLVLVVGGKSDGKATISIAISDDLAKAKNWHAGNLVRESAKLIGGGGGGQPFFATAGGKDPNGLPKAIEYVKAELIK
ncbi:MAG: alanine--tRNA ligase [Bacteroidetes bacterium]|nr:alanine--tRNA ligase [Bacteroidota bacterium]